MSAIQVVCAVAVPLLWGYQFVAIKVGVTEFPPLFFLALRFLAIALLLVPFVKRPARQQFGPIAAISIFLGGLNFGLFYVGLGLGSGSMSAAFRRCGSASSTRPCLKSAHPKLSRYEGLFGSIFNARSMKPMASGNR